jgi:membrane fusion protein (multidrug efflux system)
MPFLCLLVFFLISCSKSDAPKGGGGGRSGAQTVSVEAIIAQPEQLKNSVRGVGILLPSNEVDIQAEIAGKVERVYFRDGQSVRAGTSLVKIEDDNLRAVMYRTNAKLVLARSSAERKKKQFNASAISAQEWENTQADLQIAEADSIDAAANLRKTLISAPFDGKLGIGKINRGQRLAVGDQIVKIVQKFPLKVDFSVADKYASTMKVGMDVEFIRNTENYKAVIDALESSLDGSTRTLLARAIINGQPEELVPGAPLEFMLNLPPRMSITVPPEAIGSDAFGSNLYLYKGGKAQLTRIEIGTRFIDKVEVLDGVFIGDTVLCVGASPVRNGGNVEISRIR